MLRCVFLICSALAFGANSLNADGAQVTIAVAPLYPPVAVSSRIAGTVTVRGTVNASGGITRAEVVKGHPLLSRAAKEAAAQWRFNRSSEADRSFDMTFIFVLLPEHAPEPSRTIFRPPDQIEVDLRPAPPIVNYGSEGGRKAEPPNTATAH